MRFLLSKRLFLLEAQKLIIKERIRDLKFSSPPVHFLLKRDTQTDKTTETEMKKKNIVLYICGC